MNIFVDIETIPSQQAGALDDIARDIQAPAQLSKPETIAEWHNGEGKYAGVKVAAADEAYRKTALDGGSGEIISIAFGSSLDDVVVVYRSQIENEERLLATAFKRIAELAQNHGSDVRPYFIGHNVGWDLKFLWQRAVVRGVCPPFSLPFGGRHKSEFYDTMQAWAGFGQRISQDNLCKVLGIAGKPSDISGSNVWDFVKRGDVARVAEYNMHDVETVIKIYNRINFR